MRNIIVLLCLVTYSFSFAQIGTFNSELLQKKILNKTVKLPYLQKTSYYGYITPDSSPDEIKNGKSYYYIYLWVPIALPEIGIRMVSPIPKKMKPSSKDFYSETYTVNSDERKRYFDTWISFEKAENIFSKDQINESISWKQISYNDDSSELPKQPSGNRFNSLLRVISDLNDPLQAISVGLYRIGFTSYKNGEVTGGFVAEIGSTLKIPGVMLVDNLDDLK